MSFFPSLFKTLTPLNTLNNVYSLLPIVLFIIFLPHLMTAPIVITLYIISILAYFSLHTFGIIPLPGKMIRFLLIILALFLLVMTYGFLFSQKMSLSLLAIMISLKLLEIHNEQDRRNIFLVLFLGYFILMTHFLRSQDILLALFAFVNSLILTLMLSAFNRKPQNALPVKDSMILILRLFIKAIPIAIVLFLFFPRVPGPLWSLPEDGQAGTTGLSDKMYPGSVSNLSDSDEIAFRVDFHDTIPTSDTLYWRGPVLTQTDGFLWSQNEEKPLQKPFNKIIKNTQEAVRYTITLEPHRHKWLFTLEMPIKVQGDTIKGFYFTQDLQLLNQTRIQQLTQYHITSMTGYFFSKMSMNELLLARQFPIGSNPRTYELGQQWKNTLIDTKQIVLHGLHYFKEKPFYYTKQPSVMLNNPSDQFLFDTQRGFCEHYASSFVLLMRAAGIPARVVTGYQGIEKNTVGDYYIVRQSNAHAWAEVWIAGEGWLRVDPTGMIPPERIEDDIFQTNLDRLSFSSLNLPDLPSLSAQQKTAMYELYQQINQSIDMIKHTWNNWILGYDTNKQSLLLNFMGLKANWQTLIFLLIGGLVFVILAFQLISLYQRYKNIDKVYYYYTKFIHKLNQADLNIRLSDAPEAIKQRACEHFPQKKIAIQIIIDHYIKIRYAHHSDNQAIQKLSQQFIKEVKQYKVSNKKKVLL